MISSIFRHSKGNNFQRHCFKSNKSRQYCYSQNELSKIQRLIRLKTEVTRSHMTPEIALHLVTPSCDLWHQRGEDSPFQDPFWAFYWPGGQVLSRFILDNRSLFANKTVADIGSGCGASAIASKMSGAKHVIANDIDKVAVEAINLNSELNKLKLQLCSDNLIGSYNNQWDIVLLGDMFYDPEFANVISDWVQILLKRGITLYVGDPGRTSFRNHPLASVMKLCAEYELSETCKKENNGLNTGYVWKYSEVK